MFIYEKTVLPDRQNDTVIPVKVTESLTYLTGALLAGIFL
jgi:hypothetical protein